MARQPTNIEDPVPTMAIARDALEWALEAENTKETLKHTWPFKKTIHVDFKGFKEFLEHSKGLAVLSIEAYVQKLSYFFTLLALPEHFSPIGCLAGLYKSGLVSSVMQLDILSPRLPTTKNIIIAVSHYCDYLLAICGQKNWTEAIRCIRGLKDEYLSPLKKRACRMKGESAARKMALDSQKLAKLPLFDVLHVAIKEAMIDLNTLCQEYRKKESMPWQLRHAMNTIMFGLIYTNSYAGRPGEWQTITLAEVEKFVEAGGNVLAMHQHKTYSKYGALGRHVPPGNLETIKKFMLLPRLGNTNLFFEQARGGTKPVQANKLLHKFGVVYLPGFQHPGATLQRKYFHTKLREDDHKLKALKFVSDMDGHSTKVAESHYIISDPSNDANVAKALFRHMQGKPVALPSMAELCNNYQRSLDRIMTCYYRTRQKQDEVEDTLGSDDEGDESESDESTSQVCEGSEDEALQAEAEFEQGEHELLHVDGVACMAAASAEKEPTHVGKAAGEASTIKKRKLNTDMDETHDEAHAALPGEDQAGKRTRTMLTDAQKEWVIMACTAEMGVAGVVPPKAWFQSLVDLGIEQEVLSKKNTAEGIRTFMRAHCKTK